MLAMLSAWITHTTPSMHIMHNVADEYEAYNAMCANYPSCADTVNNDSHPYHARDALCANR